MKKYIVFHASGCSTYVDAEEMRRINVDDIPIKLLFIRDDTIIAEFYCDKIVGWSEEAGWQNS